MVSPVIGRPPRLFDFHGKPMTIRQLAALAGVKFLTMHKRLKSKTAPEAVAMGKADSTRKTMPAKRSTETYEQRLSRYIAQASGLTWRHYGKRFLADQREEALCALQRLCAAGEAYAEELTLPHGQPAMRYWTSAAAAAQWKADNAARFVASGAAIKANRARLKAKPLVQKTKPLPVKQPPKHSQARVDPHQEADTSRAKFTVCKSGFDNRFTVTSTTGGFISASECRPWARTFGG
jgi:hypothetical protein